MRSWQAWYQNVRTRRQLLHWAASGHLDAAGLRRGLCLLGDPPDVEDWRRFWLTVCGWLGVMLLGSSAVCFIAANWVEMGRFARLGLVQAGIVAAAFVALFARHRRALAVLALWLACVLLGVLLALIGQVYQLGADPWQLFASWALLMLPWALAARHSALWLLFVALVNVAFFLAQEGGLATLVLFVVVNAAMLATWEWVLRRRTAFAGGLSGPRLIAALLLAGTSVRSFDGWGFAGHALQPPWLVWLATTLALAGFYLRVRRDLPVLALATLSVIVVLTGHLALVFYEHLDDVVAVSSLLALLVIIQATVAASWLRRLAREGEGS